MDALVENTPQAKLSGTTLILRLTNCSLASYYYNRKLVQNFLTGLRICFIHQCFSQ